MTDVSAFVLTIDKAGGLRRLHAEREMIAVGLPFFMVEGIKVADLKARTAYSPALNLLLQKRSLAPPEIAIYEGHRRIWQEIVARKLDMALVVEDDVRFTDRAAFAEVLEHLDHIRDKWDVVKFFDYKPKKPIETYAFRNLKLVTYKYPASGAVAYLINARAAEALLRRKRIFRPVDEDFPTLGNSPCESGRRNPISPKRSAPNLADLLPKPSDMRSAAARISCARYGVTSFRDRSLCAPTSTVGSCAG